MIATAIESPMDCEKCPIRRIALFRAVEQGHLPSVQPIRHGQFLLEPGTNLYYEGTTATDAYTLFDGWAIRYKTLPNGRRQILGFSLPGDLLGFQPFPNGVLHHNVQALTKITVCAFKTVDLLDLLKQAPDVAIHLSWMCGRYEVMSAEHLTSVGRRPAKERLAHLLLELDYRVRAYKDTSDDEHVILPLTQEHLADALGLTSIHISRTLRTLRQEGLLDLRSGKLRLLDRPTLVTLTGFREEVFHPHPIV